MYIIFIFFFCILYYQVKKKKLNKVCPNFSFVNAVQVPDKQWPQNLASHLVQTKQTHISESIENIGIFLTMSVAFFLWHFFIKGGFFSFLFECCYVWNLSHSQSGHGVSVAIANIPRSPSCLAGLIFQHKWTTHCISLLIWHCMVL